MKRKLLFFAIAALFSCYVTNTQAQTDIMSCMKSESAMKFIGDMAHPAQTVLDVKYVGATSSYIDINIQFKSLMRSYWEPYRITLKQYAGVTYPYSIDRTKKVSIYEPFLALGVLTSISGSIFREMGYSTSDREKMIRALYGTSEENLTKEQKAAINLMNYCTGE